MPPPPAPRGLLAPMVSTNRPTIVVSVAAALMVALAGCTSGDDAASDAPSASASASGSPTASPTPTDPAEAAEQERIDDALQRYEEYREIDERHQKAGTDGYDEIEPYLGHPDIWNNERMKWDYITENDYKMVGDVKPILSVVSAEYDGDPLADTISGHRVDLRLCIDSTGFDIVDADGKIVPNERQGRYIKTVVLQGQPGELWAINETTTTEKKC